MSITTQALECALNNLEHLIKQASIKIKKTINDTAYDEYDYFVISLELTPTGFKPRFEIESDGLDALAYQPNIIAIFVDEGFTFLRWENLTKNDIKDFKNTLTIKLEEARKYDALVDWLGDTSTIKEH